MKAVAIRGCLFAGVLVWAAACGGGDDTPPANTCTVETCKGCCDANGNCVPGEDNAYCGRGGASCRTCAATEACVGGSCVLGGQCSPSTCAGCCLGGRCMAGHELSACGTAGQACDICTDGEICVSGVCGRVCDATTCPDGCCFNGHCIKADQQSANICGGAGLACRVCGDGEQCISQKCEAVSCGLATCPGCCDDKGNCKSGDGETACGKGGELCQVCGREEACLAQVCQTVNVTCNDVCGGCCDAQGNCLPGNAGTACGKTGESCSSCGSGQECVNGACICSQTSCSGCCEGATCRSGTELGACGQGGVVCAACTGPDKCLLGTCQQDCSFLTCSGCCDAQNNCIAPATDSQCGIYASDCKACDAGETCHNGSCNNPDECDGDPASCPLGCCQEGVCQVGTTQSACGDAGEPCEICGPHLVCGTDAASGDRTCVAKATARWELVVGRVTLRDGEDWDDGLEGDDRPDPFVEVLVPALGQDKEFKTDDKSNRYDATFNEYLLTATTSQLTASGVEFVVWDDDDWSDHDRIARCRLEITPLQLKRGSFTVYGCPGDAGNQSLLTISFTFRIAGI